MKKILLICPVMLVCIIALAQRSGGNLRSYNPANINTFINMSGGTNGNVVSRSGLTNSVHGWTNTWFFSVDPHTNITWTNIDMGIWHGPILSTSAPTIYYERTNATELSLDCLMWPSNNYIRYETRTNSGQVTVSCFVKFTAFNSIGDSFDLINITGGGGEFGVFNYDDSSGNGNRFRVHSQSGANHVGLCTSNTPYWVSLYWNTNSGANGTMQCMVFNPDGWKLMYSNSINHTSKQMVETIAFGETDQHATGAGFEPKSTHVYYQDIIIDYSGNYPIYPSVFHQ